MMMIKKRVLAAVTVLVLFGISACDVTDPLEDVGLIVDVEDAAVDLRGSGVAVTIQDGETTAIMQTVANDLDVARVELNAVNLEPSFLSFAVAPPGKSVSVMDSGTLTILVSVGLPPAGPLFPLPPLVVTIEDNVVTDVQPRSISLLGGTYDISQIEAVIESLPASQRPDLADLGSLTIDQAREAVEAALVSSTGFLFSFVVQSDGISGTLTLNQLSIDARITQGVG